MSRRRSIAAVSPLTPSMRIASSRSSGIIEFLRRIDDDVERRVGAELAQHEQRALLGLSPSAGWPAPSSAAAARVRAAHSSGPRPRCRRDPRRPLPAVRSARPGASAAAAHRHPCSSGSAEIRAAAARSRPSLPPCALPAPANRPASTAPHRRSCGSFSRKQLLQVCETLQRAGPVGFLERRLALPNTADSTRLSVGAMSPSLAAQRRARHRAPAQTATAMKVCA